MLYIKLEENPVFAQGSSLATWQRHEKSPLFKIIMTYPPLGNGIPSPRTKGFHEINLLLYA